MYLIKQNEFEFNKFEYLRCSSKINKNFNNLGKIKMRPNYLKFLELVLRLIESEVEFYVYRSFLLSSIVLAIKFKYLHKWTISNTYRLIAVTIEFEYLQTILTIILNLFFIAHLFDLTVLNCIELHKFWHYSTNLGMNSYSRDQTVSQIFLSIFNYYWYRIDSNYID